MILGDNSCWSNFVNLINCGDLICFFSHSPHLYWNCYLKHIVQVVNIGGTLLSPPRYSASILNDLHTLYIACQQKNVEVKNSIFGYALCAGRSRKVHSGGESRVFTSSNGCKGWNFWCWRLRTKPANHGVSRCSCLANGNISALFWTRVILFYLCTYDTALWLIYTWFIQSSPLFLLDDCRMQTQKRLSQQSIWESNLCHLATLVRVVP